jgi:MscS family membrane protein
MFAAAFQGLIILNVAWFIARLFDAIFVEYAIPATAKSKSDFDDQIIPMIRRGVRMIVWTLGIIVALNNAGFNVGALLAGLGIGGLAFAARVWTH